MFSIQIHFPGSLKFHRLQARVEYLLSFMYLLFTNWVQGPYEEIQAQGFSYSPSLYFLLRHEHPVSK